jgi:hypothetical protein
MNRRRFHKLEVLVHDIDRSRFRFRTTMAREGGVKAKEVEDRHTIGAVEDDTHYVHCEKELLRHLNNLLVVVHHDTTWFYAIDVAIRRIPRACEGLSG